MRILRRAIPVIAAAVLALGVTACDPDNNLSSPASLSTTAGLVPARAEQPAIRHTSPPANPLSTNGRWKVPEQIAPGTYQAIPRNSFGGYWETTSRIGAEPGDPGWIANDFITGNDYVTIGPDVRYIKLDDVTLIPAEG
jgi:hypothetical protein